MNSAVLDASALMALLKGEPGGSAVAAALPGAAISAVNLAEVVSKLADAGLEESDIHESLDGLRLEVIEFDRQQAFEAGGLIAHTKVAGLSLGDRACLALARRLAAAVLTADRTWQSLALGVQVVLVR